MRWKIRANVGQGQRNEPSDVKIVQTLLNRSSGGHGELLREDGFWGPKTMARLIEFQKNTVHLHSADSIVNVKGPTFSKLANNLNLQHRHHTNSSHPTILVPEGEMLAAIKKHAKHSLDNHKIAWFNRALPAAKNVKAQWGVPIAVTLAQGAVESDWGRNAPNNMFFGIKGHSPKGTSVSVTTHEHLHGKNEVIQDSFRSYASLEEAAEDYGRFLASNKRYRAAFAFCNQPEKFIDIVAKAGYATNPIYEKIILSVIRSNGLSDYDNPIINNPARFTNSLHQ